jgi:hypothetical protein
MDNHDQPTQHVLHTDQGQRIVTATMQQIAQLQDAQHARQQAYHVGQQLDLLYKDIEQGLFGDAAQSGGFANYVRNIKQAWPKPSGL